jgi:hypothetical protein
MRSPAIRDVDLADMAVVAEADDTGTVAAVVVEVRSSRYGLIVA